MPDDILPLPSRTEGEPEGVGICLSGGGIRAASFALGALQALHERKKLLFGPKSADYLAAVSGGSYVAATFTSIAGQIATGQTPSTCAPLAEGSPEVSHIVGHGDFLRRWRRGWYIAAALLSALGILAAYHRWGLWVAAGVLAVFVALTLRGWLATGVFFGIFALINLAGFAFIFLWTSVILVGAGESMKTISAADAVLNPVSYSGLLDPWGWFMLAIVCLVGGRLLLREFYRTGWRMGWRLAGVGMVLGGALSLLYALDRDVPSVWLVGALLAAVLTLVTQRPGLGVSAPRLLMWGAGALAVQTVGFVLFAQGVDETNNFDDGSSAVLVGAAIFGVLPMSAVLARVSMHHLNRGRVASCFALKRTDDGTGIQVFAAHEQSLSGLASHTSDPTVAFPRLLICATVNIDVRDADTHRWRRCDSFVFSPEVCGVPGDSAAYFRTEDLERARRPIAFKRESPVSLMSAVACSGAAVSPGMGARTRSVFRSLTALANLRLGTWLANPYNSVVRGQVDTSANWWRGGKWPDRANALIGGYDEFVPELLGLQRSDAPRAYISDGGHYDNLGLIALLRARCRMIWCVDSQADRAGRASQLSDTVELAIQEGLIEGITLRAPAGGSPYQWFSGTDGMIRHSHGIYDVAYRGGGSATLIVIKLGLTQESDEDLKHYSSCDRRWLGPLRRIPCFLFARYPFDGTFVRIAFEPARVENYRRLGFANTARAIDDLDARTATSNASPLPVAPAC